LWPRWTQIVTSPKRIIGTSNLYFFKRALAFSLDVQKQVVAKIVDLRPDLVLFSGDLTSQSLASEFQLAREILDPILSKFPTLMIPGNHDAYTREAISAKRMFHYFGNWMRNVNVDDVGLWMKEDADVNVGVVMLNPCRPTLVTSSGRYPRKQLVALRRVLNSTELDAKFIIAMTHYPIVHASGALYSTIAYTHSAVNDGELVATFQSSKNKPDLILHGHIHKGFSATLAVGERCIPIYNPGAAGQTFSLGDGNSWLHRKKRCSAFNLYHVTSTAVRPNSYATSVTRFIHNGTTFEQERVPYESGF